MYMTGDDIRALSRRLPVVCNAAEEELEFWMEEATDVLNNFVQQDFTYELQTTKRARVSNNTLVYLPKPLSGIVTVYDCFRGTVVGTYDSAACASASGPLSSAFNSSSGFQDSISSSSLNSTTGDPVELFPGDCVIGYYSNNSRYPRAAARQLEITGDWGFANTSDDLLLPGVNSLKALYEAHRISAVFHTAADALNPVLSPDATDFDSAAVLLNELKGVLNSHFGDFNVHLEAGSTVIMSPDVTDEASAFDLLTEARDKYNWHIKNTIVHLEMDTENVANFSTDYANSVMPRQIRRVYLRLVQRIAIRDDEEDIRQANSVYASETLGDGYSYDLSNGTLRNLMRPEEAHMLLPFVNRGKVVM